jgi:hypothetical protein
LGGREGGEEDRQKVSRPTDTHRCTYIQTVMYKDRRICLRTDR